MPRSNSEPPAPGLNERQHVEECLSATDLCSALEREIMGLVEAVWKYRTEDNPDLEYWQLVEGKPLPYLGIPVRCPRWLVNVERLLETALTQWPRPGMPFETVHPRLEALRTAALALVNEAVGAEGEAWLRWGAATKRIDKAMEQVRAMAAVAGRGAENSCHQVKGPPAGQEDGLHDTSKDEITIVSHGGRQYSMGGSDPITLSENEDSVLDAFLGSPPTRPPLASMDKPELGERSGLGERAPTILGKLRQKYGGRFADAIMLPGKKARGGYQVRIRRA